MMHTVLANVDFEDLLKEPSIIFECKLFSQIIYLVPRTINFDYSLLIV